MTKNYKCEICEKKFSSKRGLAIHKGKVHKKRGFAKIKTNRKKLSVLIFLFLVLLFSIPFLISIYKKIFQNSIIKIHSPLNKTYFQKEIPIHVSCGDEPCLWIKHKIDDGILSKITCGEGEPCVLMTETDEYLFVTSCTECYSFNLTGIEFSDGSHSVDVRVKDYDGREYDSKVTFTIRCQH